MLDTYYKYNFVFNTIFAFLVLVIVQYVLEYDLTFVEMLLVLFQVDLMSEIQKLKRGAT